jgi:ABC-2 type transport system ATP-binding protein
MKIMIKIDGLTKRYGLHTVVDNLSFECDSGEVLGFLGPNGAGKSTTMKMITGFLDPDSGSASICGIDVLASPKAAKAQLGYLPEGAPAYGDMTPAAFLSFIAEIRGYDANEIKARVTAAVSRAGLGSVLNQRIETLSKGFKRRVGIAQALLHDPPVLIMDEPTDGLDPNQKHEVRQLINSMAANKIIVVSTHILEEVDAMCTRAIVIAGGRVLADDTPGGLEARSRYHDAVTLRIPDPATLLAARDALTALPDVASVEIVQREERLTAFPRPGKQILAEVSALAARAGWGVRELHLESGRLDEVFRAITHTPVAARPESAHA